MKKRILAPFVALFTTLASTVVIPSATTTTVGLGAVTTASIIVSGCTGDSEMDASMCRFAKKEMALYDDTIMWAMENEFWETAEALDKKFWAAQAAIVEFCPKESGEESTSVSISHFRGGGPGKQAFAGLVVGPRGRS